MQKTYKDYFHQNVLTIPDTFIDVKTGDHQNVSPKILEEIKYHSENNTLNHLIFSALHDYFHKASIPQEAPSDLLTELLEIKRMLYSGNEVQTASRPSVFKKSFPIQERNMKEIADVLEAFGG
ncbi:hypothetical protein SAMN04487936_104179 [Halobacillus dabanensis]|uniref:Uncharacterized protein n=1 Tax=Halobacillus dabanensis TaxID=240302 RepID=A0A1I3U3Q0_HALDA|nr:hypothetical protein [Halobacillus dabanensis]SFJ78178.1 hypothetical protein SAMN04487936_104179 [Halobacillus dabanensis]